MGPRNAYKDMLNNMITPIDHVMNHQNQTLTNGIRGHIRYIKQQGPRRTDQRCAELGAWATGQLLSSIRWYHYQLRRHHVPDRKYWTEGTALCIYLNSPISWENAPTDSVSGFCSLLGFGVDYSSFVPLFTDMLQNRGGRGAGMTSTIISEVNMCTWKTKTMIEEINETNRKWQ
jgi:hypothetical protein